MAGPAALPDAGVGDLRGPPAVVLWGTGLAGLAAIGCSVALGLESDHATDPVVHAALLNWMTLTFLLAGLVAWWRRPESRFGPLMIGAGFATVLSTLSWANAALPYTFGQALDLLAAVLFLHVFLAFPTGTLRRPFERVVVATAYVAAIGLEVGRMVLGGFGADNLLEVVDAPAAANVVLRLQLTTISACALAGIAVLAVRRRHAGRPLRRSIELLVNAFGLGLVMIAVLLLTAAFNGPGFETIRRATFVVIGLAPLAFLLGLLHARLARSAVGDLVVALRTDPAPADLRDALSRALRDRSLMLAYWLPAYGAYADSEGHEVELPGPGEGRATTIIEREGERIAALVHDPALGEEPELLGAVTAAAGIAIENARLQADLRCRLDDLRDSRARVIEAGQAERRRLERNLHDGAQQRLVALSIELGRLEQRLRDDPEAKTRLDEARRQVATSLAELRDVARGLHPAVVTAHGLEVSLEQIAALAPVPVQLDVKLGARLPEALEVAAFYIVSESLANIGKHARAASAAVHVGRQDGTVVVEVVDDGIGGAATVGGSGLRGLADRVEALDGRLRVWSPEGGGTRLRAELPCGS